MKTASTKTKVLTANRLTDGIAVWLGANGEWTTSLKEAFLARHDDAVAAIEAAGQQALDDNRVVDVNVIEVEETEAGPRPFRLRERIRSDGPTIDYAPAFTAGVSHAA
ncbi:MAG: nitrite reductase [Hoeflea sp.]|uniref:DUF2849 domain-containing protein n=1 Tax=Hoeflea sp. TaxID=1940281 RepID=UPI000C0EFAF3|nr:DUF2849 domain-containing protein [Hoeflea sp.]PHR24804.1 MAG: nitrite reductase [Hoeflea sp.]|tara:strand:- start:59687 stop:60010 length:324 start_codon:yes stop_codon:yes gene_type:complete